MLVFKAELMYVPKPVGGEKGGGGLFVTRALRLSQKKKALSVHYVPTTSARTPTAHRVQERVARPLWGAASTLPSWGPKRGRKCYITPAFSGVPKQRGTKSELAASPLPSRGPKRGRKCYVTPAFSRIPKRGGGQNQNWQPHPCLLGGPKEGGNATSPPHSWGSPTKGTKSKHQKEQKNLRKNTSIVSLALPRVLQTAPTGD